jgi:hypothetical protein
VDRCVRGREEETRNLLPARLLLSTKRWRRPSAGLFRDDAKAHWKTVRWKGEIPRMIIRSARAVLGPRPQGSRNVSPTHYTIQPSYPDLVHVQPAMRACLRVSPSGGPYPGGWQDDRGLRPFFTAPRTRSLVSWSLAAVVANPVYHFQLHVARHHTCDGDKHSSGTKPLGPDLIGSTSLFGPMAEGSSPEALPATPRLYLVLCLE